MHVLWCDGHCRLISLNVSKLIMGNIVLCIPVAMHVAMPVVMATLVLVLEEVWLLIFLSLYFPVSSTSPGFKSIWSLSVRPFVGLLICPSVRPSRF